MNRDLNNKGILNRVSTSVQNGKFRVVFMYDEFIGQFNRLTQTLETYLHLITISPLFWPIKNISLQINYIEEFKSPHVLLSRGYVPNNFSRRNIFFYFRKCLDHFPPFALVGYIHRLDRTYKLSKTRATFSPHLHSHSYSLCAPSLLLGFLLRGPSWRGDLERESSFSVWFVDVLMSQVVVVGCC